MDVKFSIIIIVVQQLSVIHPLSNNLNYVGSYIANYHVTTGLL